MAQIESGIVADNAALAEQTLPEYETDVVDALAALVDCTYGEASSIASIHADIVEAGYEEHERPSVIARELDAQSRVAGVPTMPQLQQACAGRAQVRAIARARKDIMEALVEFGSAQADIASNRALRLVGATNRSGLLVRAQARANAYAELLEPILETKMQGGTPAQVNAAVEAVCESLVGAFAGARA